MKISILMHEKDPPLTFYALSGVCDVWRSKGHQIEELHGFSRPVRGDIVFLHVGLTVTPSEYLDAVADHPCVVNRCISDISKRRISRIRVHSPDEWHGPVIVKTVRNHGGSPERRMRRGTVLGRLWNLVGRAGLVVVGLTDYLNAEQYPVYASARDVPHRVFANPALLVERFVPEREAGRYWTRVCGFLGDRAYSEMRGSRHAQPFEGEALVWREVPVHDDVAVLRKRMGFGYGCFDYVVHDGRMTLFDTNRTPGAARWDRHRLERRARILAPGLESLVRSGYSK